MYQDAHEEAVNQTCAFRAGAYINEFCLFFLDKHSMQHPNLKMYMLEHLEPSVALTGGPWYTDNELDTEFIKLLSTACLRFIQDNVRTARVLSASRVLDDQCGM